MLKLENLVENCFDEIQKLTHQRIDPLEEKVTELSSSIPREPNTKQVN